MNILMNMLRSLLLSVVATFAHKQVFGRLNGRQNNNQAQSNGWGAPNQNSNPEQPAQSRQGVDAVPDVADLFGKGS